MIRSRSSVANGRGNCFGRLIRGTSTIGSIAQRQRRDLSMLGSGWPGFHAPGPGTPRQSRDPTPAVAEVQRASGSTVKSALQFIVGGKPRSSHVAEKNSPVNLARRLPAKFFLGDGYATCKKSGQPPGKPPELPASAQAHCGLPDYAAA